MSRFVGSWAAFAAVLALTAGFLHTARAWAEGVGPRYPTPEIRYDPNADDDEDTTDAPTGFTAIDWRPRSSSFGGFTISRPIELADPQEGTAKSFELKGVYAEYSTSLYLRLRSEFRFPSFDDSEEAEPTYTLWANEEAEEELSFAETLRINLEKLTPDEAARAFGFESAEAAQEWAKRLEEWGDRVIARQNARDWLGDEGYDKIKAEFGPGPDSTAASDASEWQKTYYYCGGACVAAGY